MTKDQGSGSRVQGSGAAQRTQNQNVEPGTLSPERDTPMTSTYVQVMVLEAVIIVALWVFGRLFS
jgi:hypothetical protein